MEISKQQLKLFWSDCQKQRVSHNTVSTWWEIGKLYIKIIATRYCVQLQKNIRTKQSELTHFIDNEQTKTHTDQNEINIAYNQLQDIENYRLTGSIIRSKEQIIVEQEKPSFSIKKNINRNKIN